MRRKSNSGKKIKIKDTKFLSNGLGPRLFFLNMEVPFFHIALPYENYWPSVSLLEIAFVLKYTGRKGC